MRKSLRPDPDETTLIRGRFVGLIARLGMAPEGIWVFDEERRKGKLDPPGVVIAGEERARFRPVFKVVEESKSKSEVAV
jgi:hypothetical protein